VSDKTLGYEQDNIDTYSFIREQYPDRTFLPRALKAEDERCLHKYARGQCLELGTFRGGSASVILTVSDKLTTIERYIKRAAYPDYTHAIVKERLSKLGNVEVLSGQFKDHLDYIKNGSMDFLFIDGMHDYKSVKRDYEMFFCKLKPGGILVFHDYTYLYDGVVKLVRELKSNSECLKFIEIMGWCAVFKKVDRNDR